MNGSRASSAYEIERLEGELIAWMRTQAGTLGFRALLCMDEVMGVMPSRRLPDEWLEGLGHRGCGVIEKGSHQRGHSAGFHHQQT